MARPPSGPIEASAIGSAMTPAPTASVSVRENTVQKGGSDSSRETSAAHAHRIRSGAVGRSAKRLSIGTRWSRS